MVQCLESYHEKIHSLLFKVVNPRRQISCSFNLQPHIAVLSCGSLSGFTFRKRHSPLIKNRPPLISYHLDAKFLVASIFQPRIAVLPNGRLSGLTLHSDTFTSHQNRTPSLSQHPKVISLPASVFQPLIAVLSHGPSSGSTFRKEHSPLIKIAHLL